MSDFAYTAEAVLTDGSTVVLDLEKRGWADPELLAQINRWSIVPKTPGLPIVVVHIPEGGKAVFKSRVYGVVGTNDGTNTPMFRAYGIGYKLGKLTHWMWVLPTGDIEVTTGDDLWLGDLLLAHMKGSNG